MIGTIINTLAVVVGSCLGLRLKKGIPERCQKVFFQVIGLFTLSLGITMVVSMQHILVVIFALVLGSLFGIWCNIEKHIELLGY